VLAGSDATQGAVFGIATAVLTLAITWPVARALVAIGLIDLPNHRSMHSAPVPRGGGAGVAIAVTVMTLIGVGFGFDNRVLVILALSLGPAGFGFLDDRYNLPFTPRLIVQIGLAGAVITIVQDPHFATTSRPLVPVVVITVLWVLGCCNAINFMDGVNGITGLHTVLFSIHLIVIARADELVWLPAALSLGAAFGFLYWNAVRGRVFLGDGGAYFLGAYLAILVVVASVRTSTPLVAAAPFAVYAADTATTLFRRIARHAELTRGHREHVYQRLALAGHSHLTVAGFAVACSSVCSASAIAVDRSWIAPGFGFAGVSVALVVYLSSPRWFPAPPGSAR
jgi:UDP-N-acetylmuramyl pentapeptide phosphotransferase/UDP-N-acetylglucosamine-1-phosphate transferase